MIIDTVAPPSDVATIRLRPVRLEDWPTIHEWARRPDVTRYQSWGPNRAVETRGFVIAAVAAASARPRTRHVLTVTEAGRIVGLVDVTLRLGAAECADLGYAVHPDHWGRGVGTAAARLAADLAFTGLGVTRLAATCDAANHASVRVLEKLGMHRDHTIPRDQWLGDRWRDTHVFTLTAETHSRSTAPSSVEEMAR